MGAEATLTGSLGRLFALVENYPDLKGDAGMRQVSEELSSTENKVAFARQAYNDAVMAYNTARETFPTNVIASFFSFQHAASFTVDTEEERQAPKVSFK